MNAHTAVRHPDIEHQAVLSGTVRNLLTSDAELHPAVFRVFHGIGHEVEDDLLDPHLIPVEQIGYRAVDVKPQLKTVIVDPLLRHHHNIVEQC